MRLPSAVHALFAALVFAYLIGVVWWSWPPITH
jgi:hypothetical protein